MLPDDLFARLPLLEYLDVRANALETLPAAPGPTRLAHLDAFKNLLSAPPTALIRASPHLAHLVLSSNPLRPELPAHPALRTVLLCDMPAAPSSLPPSLHRLDLSYTPLTRLPPLPQTLVELSARHCGLESLPTSLSLPSLRRLDLAHNPLTSVPPALASLPSLEFLDLWATRLTALPAAFARADKMQTVVLPWRGFREPPEDIARSAAKGTGELKKWLGERYGVEKEVRRAESFDAGPRRPGDREARRAGSFDLREREHPVEHRRAGSFDFDPRGGHDEDGVLWGREREAGPRLGRAGSTDLRERSGERSGELRRDEPAPRSPERESQRREREERRPSQDHNPAYDVRASPDRDADHRTSLASSASPDRVSYDARERPPPSPDRASYDPRERPHPSPDRDLRRNLDRPMTASPEPSSPVRDRAGILRAGSFGRERERDRDRAGSPSPVRPQLRREESPLRRAGSWDQPRAEDRKPVGATASIAAAIAPAARRSPAKPDRLVIEGRAGSGSAPASPAGWSPRKEKRDGEM
ncbi:hypothetical protein DFJ74DRAFT_688142 [Hyaloraphidium curvatum]|nr:hypothetical protein DFJ74DRAFT_688142 [Hyaloraphidium curvatum]